jgi:hypothetical protein
MGFVCLDLPGGNNGVGCPGPKLDSVSVPAALAQTHCQVFVRFGGFCFPGNLLLFSFAAFY